MKGNLESLGSYEVERHSLMVNERKKKIEKARADIEEIENLNWEKEIQVSRARGVFEKILRQVNSVIIQSLSGSRLSLTPDNVAAGFGEIQTELNDTLRESRNMTRKLEIDSQNLKAKEEETLREKEAMKKVLKQYSEKMSNLEEEKKDLQTAITEEEEKLDEKLWKARTDLEKIRGQGRGLNGEFDGKKRIETAEKRLREVKEARVEKYEAGQAFLKAAISRTVKHFEDCNELREKTAQKLNTKIHEASAQVKKIAAQIEEEF